MVEGIWYYGTGVSMKDEVFTERIFMLGNIFEASLFIYLWFLHICFFLNFVKNENMYFCKNEFIEIFEFDKNK